MSNLFISHSSRDSAAAKELQAKLEEQGHRSVFLDLDPEKGIQVGESWERTLYTKLRACRAVVALCSDSYLASQWCFAEIALARMEGKELFVLQIDPWSEQTQMPSILTEEQYADLRTDKDDGYQRLWNGFKVKGIVAAEAREWKPEEPPYPGLRAFHEEDAPIFFGRDEEVREGVELLNRVRRQGHPRLVMVLGSSGSGKSSLVRAGIVPQLCRDRGQWLVVKPFRPGQQPARELAASLSQAFNDAGQISAWEEIYRWLEPTADGELAAPASEPPATAEPSPAAARERLLQALTVMEGELAVADDQVASSVRRVKDYLSNQQTTTHLPSGGAPPQSGASPLAEIAARLRLQSGFAEATVVLVIDQFEELLGHDAEHPASRFLAMLRAAMETEDRPLLVIGTMRSDYLGALQSSSPLQGFGFRSLSVGPMSKEGMRQIIEEPAKLGQIQLENGLSDLLLEDTETSDALPLLAFTLRMMWDRYRDKRLLEIREYKELGGLQGAVAQVAEETFEDVLERVQDKDSRDALARELRDAFLGMARPAAEGSGWARQPMIWDQLSERVQPALVPFIAPQRLLIKRQDGSVEVAHEALFRSWDRLKGWLDENAEGLHLLREIQVEAKKWAEAGTDEKSDYLWSGGRLALALELRDGGILSLKDLDRSFLEASDRAEKADRRRKRRVARLITGGSVAAAVIMGVLGWVMYLQWQEALRSESLFLADLARQQIDKGDAVTGTLLALEGLKDGKSSNPTQFLRPYVAAAQGALDAATQPGTWHDWVLKGHADQVFHAAFSPDGTRIVTASKDGTARLWEADGIPVRSNDREPIVLRGHTDHVTSAAFSPDGKRIVTASADNTARLWVPGADGKWTVIAVLKGDKGHKSKLWSAAFSPNDGKRIVTASEDTTARLWEREPGSGPGAVWRMTAVLLHTKPVYSAAFSPDGKRIVTASADNTARLWEADGNPVRSNDRDPVVLKGHTKLIRRAYFSPDGTRIVTASWDKTARVWAPGADGKWTRIAELSHKLRVNSVAFSPDGTRIVTASEDKTARVWEPDADGKWAMIAALGHDLRVSSVAFSRDGTRIVTASWDKTARVWDAAKGSEIAILDEGDHTDILISAAFSPDNARIVTASKGGTTHLWKLDLESGSGAAWRKIAELKHTKPMNSAAFSRDGTRIVTGSDDYKARVWAPGANGKWTIIAVLEGHTGVNSVAFSPDGTRILTASKDGTAHLWKLDLESGPGADWRKIAVLDGHRGTNISAAFSADNSRIVSFSKGTTKAPRLWDAATGKLIAELEGHTGIASPEGRKEIVYSAAFSADGTRVVTTSLKARVWDAAKGTEIAVLDGGGHTNILTSAAFSPDNSYIVTTSKDTTARLWEPESGSGPNAVWRKIAVLRGHTDRVTSAVFSADGKRIVTAARDKTARLWDATAGSEIAVLKGHTDRVTSAYFLPGDKRIVTASRDKTARVWNMPPPIQDLIDRSKKNASRCLTTDQRAQFHLAEAVPRWCYEMKKWPYHDPDLKLPPRWYVQPFVDAGKWIAALYQDVRQMVAANGT